MKTCVPTCHKLARRMRGPTETIDMVDDTPIHIPNFSKYCWGWGSRTSTRLPFQNTDVTTASCEDFFDTLGQTNELKTDHKTIQGVQ